MEQLQRKNGKQNIMHCIETDTVDAKDVKFLWKFPSDSPLLPLLRLHIRLET